MENTTEFSKGYYVRKGIEKRRGINNSEGYYDNPFRGLDAVADLSYLIEWLTSADKALREEAKKQVRELVKLGKEAESNGEST